MKTMLYRHQAVSNGGLGGNGPVAVSGDMMDEKTKEKDDCKNSSLLVLPQTPSSGNAPLENARIDVTGIHLVETSGTGADL